MANALVGYHGLGLNMVSVTNSMPDQEDEENVTTQSQALAQNRSEAASRKVQFDAEGLTMQDPALLDEQDCQTDAALPPNSIRKRPPVGLRSGQGTLFALDAPANDLGPLASPVPSQFTPTKSNVLPSLDRSPLNAALSLSHVLVPETQPDEPGRAVSSHTIEPYLSTQQRILACDVIDAIGETQLPKLKSPKTHPTSITAMRESSLSSIESESDPICSFDSDKHKGCQTGQKDLPMAEIDPIEGEEQADDSVCACECGLSHEYGILFGCDECSGACLCITHLNRVSLV